MFAWDRLATLMCGGGGLLLALFLSTLLQGQHLPQSCYVTKGLFSVNLNLVDKLVVVDVATVAIVVVVFVDAYVVCRCG